MAETSEVNVQPTADHVDHVGREYVLHARLPFPPLHFPLASLTTISFSAFTVLEGHDQAAVIA